jgi:hypothetical protein
MNGFIRFIDRFVLQHRTGHRVSLYYVVCIDGLLPPRSRHMRVCIKCNNVTIVVKIPLTCTFLFQWTNNVTVKLSERALAVKGFKGWIPVFPGDIDDNSAATRMVASEGGQIIDNTI